MVKVLDIFLLPPLSIYPRFPVAALPKNYSGVVPPWLDLPFGRTQDLEEGPFHDEQLETTSNRRPRSQKRRCDDVCISLCHQTCLKHATMEADTTYGQLAAA